MGIQFIGGTPSIVPNDIVGSLTKGLPGASNGGFGNLLNIRVFGSTQTPYVPTPGTNSVLVILVGGGGGGAGGVVNGAGTTSVGSGGNAGSIGIAYFSSGLTGHNLLIGSGGAGSNTTLGGNGGATIWNGITALGGNGGTGTQVVFSTNTAVGAPAAPTLCTGANLFNGASPQAYPGVFHYANSAYQGSIGGQSPLGGGGGAPALNGTAGNGNAPGAGGGGSGATPSSGPFSGGNGSTGCAIFYEFA